MKPLSPVALELLLNNSTRKYHIKFEGYKANHYAHGIIALHRMGASDARLQQYSAKDTGHLEPSENFLLTEEEKSTMSFKSLKGSRKGYQDCLDHYEKRFKDTYNQDCAKIVQGEFPELTSAMHVEALHGLIHVGYGLSVGHGPTICEGLAYNYYCFNPIAAEEAELMKPVQGGTESLLDLMKEAGSNKKWNATMSNPGPGPEFMKNVHAILQTHGDEVVALVNRIKLPGTDTESIRNFMVDSAITAYTISAGVNDFFLLHGCTGGWSLREIMPLFTDPSIIGKMYRVFMSALVAVYLVQGSPSLDPSKLSPKGSIKQSWDEIIAECIGKDREVHVLKLVQVCYDMGQQFPENDTLYKQACFIAMNNPFRMK